MAVVHGVLDLTFMDVSNEEDFEQACEARMSVASPSKSIRNTSLEKTEGTANTSPQRRKRRDMIKAIRLGNNEIEVFDTIVQSIALKFDVSNIQWLDLSFNHITTIMVDLDAALPYLV